MRRMKQLKQASGVSGISKEISCCKSVFYGPQLREIVKYKPMIVDIRYYLVLVLVFAIQIQMSHHRTYTSV